HRAVTKRRAEPNAAPDRGRYSFGAQCPPCDSGLGRYGRLPSVSPTKNRTAGLLADDPGRRNFPHLLSSRGAVRLCHGRRAPDSAGLERARPDAKEVVGRVATKRDYSVGGLTG